MTGSAGVDLRFFTGFRSNMLTLAIKQVEAVGTSGVGIDFTESSSYSLAARSVLA